MKKKIIIDKCIDCPYSKSVVIEGSIKVVCFGRNKIHYLGNDTRVSIPSDCPLETVEE